ncbi:DnaJ domain-containing protein [Cronobacter sakazakii]|nr:DnaJ domain-containing protein [Cronobacter sakazakii]
MNIQEALNVFGLSGDVTEKEINKAFKRLSLKYHPDKNPQLNGEMMKMLNAARDFLLANVSKIKQAQAESGGGGYDYSEEVEAVLKALCEMAGVLYEVIGNWVWISGDTKTHKDALKALNCKWASKKKQWFYRPEEHKSSRNRREHSIEEIREKYGSYGQKSGYGRKALQAA